MKRFLLLLLLSTIAYGDQTTNLGRLSVDWPDLDHPGGAALETHIHGEILKISDNMGSRYEAFSAIADSTLSTHTHNLGITFANLGFRLFTGTHPNLTLVCDKVSSCATSGWVVSAGGTPTTQIDVTTPGSGGPHTFALVVTNSGLAPSLQTAYDGGNVVTTTSGNPVDIDGTADTHALELTPGSAAHLRLNGATSGTVDLTVPATPTSYTLTLPTDDGTVDQFLKTNGSGITSWADVPATLQDAYEGGNTITTDAGNGDLIITGTENVVLSAANLRNSSFTGSWYTNPTVAFQSTGIEFESPFLAQAAVTPGSNNAYHELYMESNVDGGHNTDNGWGVNTTNAFSNQSVSKNNLTMSINLKSGDGDQSTQSLAKLSKAANAGVGQADIKIDGNGKIDINSSSNSNNDAVATPSISLLSGNKTSGTGNSGAITLQTGTSLAGNGGNITLKAGESTGGTDGKIILDDANLPTTIGYVWTSQTTTGEGAWAAAGGGVANLQEAYEGGNTIQLKAAEGNLIVSDDGSSNNQVVLSNKGGVYISDPSSTRVTPSLVVEGYSNLKAIEINGGSPTNPSPAMDINWGGNNVYAMEMSGNGSEDIQGGIKIDVVTNALDGIEINNIGGIDDTTASIDINQTSDGDAININQSSGGQQSIDITHNSSAVAVKISNTNNTKKGIEIGDASGTVTIGKIDGASSYNYVFPASAGEIGSTLLYGASGDLTWSGSVAGWVNYSLTDADLTAAATSQEITLFTSTGSQVIEGVIIKHPTSFTGGGCSAVTTSVGITGNTAKFAAAFDVFQAPGATVFQSSHQATPEFTSTAVFARFDSTGCNVNALTAGDIDIWIKTASLP